MCLTCINWALYDNAMQHMYFFGYGSLVNAGTHDHAPLYPARAHGWRRAWVAVPDQELCFLSAIADPASYTDGAIAPVPGTGKGGAKDRAWAALDLRESGYDRHEQSAAITHDSPAEIIALYAVPPETHLPSNEDHPVLLSYLDTVIAGFLDIHGLQGAKDFFATTEGWSAPILNDRDRPRYPRTTALNQEARAIVDQGLIDRRSRILTT